MKVEDTLKLERGALIRLADNVNKSIDLFGDVNGRKRFFAGTNQVVEEVEITDKGRVRVVIQHRSTFSFCPEDIKGVVGDIPEIKPDLFDPEQLVL